MPQEEIVQVALMRNCWVRAEEIFRIQLRAICPAAELRKQLLQGEGPHDLAFVTAPLVEMITAIRQSRKRLDKALEMAVAADPLASGSGVLLEAPEGYVSRQEALSILGVPNISNLVASARVVATARKVQVAYGGYRAGKAWFYPRVDIERARELDGEAVAARLDRRLRSAERDRTRGALPGEISPTMAARRLGIYRSMIVKKGLLPLRQSGDRWFVAVSDVDALAAKLEERNKMIVSGELLTTDEAAQRTGLNRKGFHFRAQDLGVKPIQWSLGRKANYYKLSDVEFIASELARQQTSRKRTRDVSALSRLLKKDPIYPAGALPLKQALAIAGLTERQWQRVKEGKSGTPMPPMHKAANRRLYCFPDELNAFRRRSPGDG